MGDILSTVQVNPLKAYYREINSESGDGKTNSNWADMVTQDWPRAAGHVGKPVRAIPRGLCRRRQTNNENQIEEVPLKIAVPSS